MRVVYSDAAIVIIEKPGGLLAVPGRGPDKQDCAATRLQHLFPTMIAQPAVHRLDMYTSGLMVFAMTTEAHRILSHSFASHQVNKRYIAVVRGIVEKHGGEIRLAFRLDPDNRPRQIYDEQRGKLGITVWQRLSVEGANTRIAFTPLTGRTHQLRVHAAHPLGLAAPIVGDSLYGLGQDGDQMLLHAASMRFCHPMTHTTVEFFSEPPF